MSLRLANAARIRPGGGPAGGDPGGELRGCGPGAARDGVGHLATDQAARGERGRHRGGARDAVPADLTGGGAAGRAHHRGGFHRQSARDHHAHAGGPRRHRRPGPARRDPHLSPPRRQRCRVPALRHGRAGPGRSALALHTRQAKGRRCGQHRHPAPLAVADRACRERTRVHRVAAEGGQRPTAGPGSARAVVSSSLD
jgi:hypothetical protein